MPLLTDIQLDDIWFEYSREHSQRHEAIELDKRILRQAFKTTDDWIEANAASFNQSLPAAARQNLTAKQKAALLAFVVMKRFRG